MHNLHQVHPSNASQHVAALSYFFYDKPSVSTQNPIPLSLAMYMKEAKGALLIAYHGQTPLACLSMKRLDDETAVIDGLYFALQGDAQLAASMLDEAIVLAQEEHYHTLLVKKRGLPKMDIHVLGFEGSQHGRYFKCDLNDREEQNQVSWCF